MFLLFPPFDQTGLRFDLCCLAKRKYCCSAFYRLLYIIVAVIVLLVVKHLVNDCTNFQKYSEIFGSSFNIFSSRGKVLH